MPVIQQSLHAAAAEWRTYHFLFSPHFLVAQAATYDDHHHDAADALPLGGDGACLLHARFPASLKVVAHL